MPYLFNLNYTSALRYKLGDFASPPPINYCLSCGCCELRSVSTQLVLELDGFESGQNTNFKNQLLIYRNKMGWCLFPWIGNYGPGNGCSLAILQKDLWHEFKEVRGLWQFPWVLG
ncbi:hypothetical protein MKX01_011762 [Papaver californicum]|nr:hypothetical protein MKX01_011762 [Papaver californicum]